MRRGVPLADGDREAWLDSLRAAIDEWLAEPELLASQLAILEPPPEALTLDVAEPVDALVERIRAALNL